MEITKYIFKPESRENVENGIPQSSRAAAARDVAMSAEKIQFLSEPCVGERAVFRAESAENGLRVISTSPLRAVRFNEGLGTIELETQNSVYVFRVDNVA